MLVYIDTANLDVHTNIDNWANDTAQKGREIHGHMLIRFILRIQRQTRIKDIKDKWCSVFFFFTLCTTKDLGGEKLSCDEPFFVMCFSCCPFTRVCGGWEGRFVFTHGSIEHIFGRLHYYSHCHRNDQMEICVHYPLNSENSIIMATYFTIIVDHASESA